MLLRVSRLADDLPQSAELELSRVLAGPDGVRVIGPRGGRGCMKRGLASPAVPPGGERAIEGGLMSGYMYPDSSGSGPAPDVPSPAP
jgi:hypothetical protein